MKLGELVQNMVSRVFKREIGHWWNHKIDQFVAERAARRNHLIDKVRKKILYVDSSYYQYDFWYKFPKDLYNWLRELKRQSPSSRLTRACHSWTSSETALLQQLDNERTRVVDLWMRTTIEGYVVEFATKSYQCYSKAEEMFNFELRGELIGEISTWIKMLLVEEGLLSLSTVGMET